MADTYTTNLNLTKPEPGAAEDTWGISLNDDLDTLDAIFSSSGTQINLNPNQVNFADGKKSIYGTGGDLEIYHDGSHSYVRNTVTGNLYIRNLSDDKDIILQSDDGAGGLVNYVQVDGSNGEVRLSHYGSEKFNTTSDGIDVTGTVVSDGLTVDGDARIEKTGAASRLVINRYDLNNADSSTIDLLESSSQGASFGNAGVYGYRLELDGSTNNLNIKSGNATTVSTRLSIERDTGYIGIGTSSPQDKLSIEGGNVSINNGSAFQVGGSVSGNTVIGTLKSESGVLTLKADSTRDVQFGSETNGTAMFIEGSNGRIGIGTTSPSRALHVNSSSIDAGIRVESTDAYTFIEFKDSTTTTIPQIGGKADDLVFRNNDTESMRITSGGSVGIGTSSPSSTLHLRDTTAQIKINSDNGQSAYLTFGDANDTTRGGLEYTSTDDLKFQTNNMVEQMVIRYTGEVGIGTSSPSTILEIASGNSGGDAALDSPTFRINNTTESADWDVGDVVGTIEYYTSDVSGNAPYVASFIKSVNETGNGTLPSGALTFGTATYNASGGAVERLRIDSSGNIGIGTASPARELSIGDGTGSPNIQLLAATAGNSRIEFGDTDDSDAGEIQYVHSDNYMQFTTNGSERLRIDSSGNLLVGKTVSSIGTAGVKLYGNGALDSSIASGNTYHVYDTVNSAFRFYVGSNGTIHATNTSISAISDKRLKENIKDLETGLKEVLNLKPRRFDWKDKTSKNVAGFIAQEVEEVLPDLIGDYKHSELKDAKSVRMGDMLPTLVKAIQEQQEQIESLKSEIAKLKGE